MLLYFSTGRFPVPVLIQLPFLLALLGTMARLTCTLSSGFLVGTYCISWYQEKPRNPSRFLLYYYSDSISELGSGVPSHFSGSRYTSANAGLLLISGLQPEDEVDYYSVTGQSSGSSLHYPQCPRQ
ncbi:unnamed protein product [Gulo gulo]|uniref:Immunoglobulin V-set domain-containing protein n=1 Tax=Gulo gulo TaxID=48420 RepID=A0A9X9PYU8_GULGU|nr:unnamed protein product [Gulo gulo]